MSLILAGALTGMAGCKVDKASQASSQVDERTGPAGSQPRAAADPRPVLVCFGDSLTAGYGANDGASYPDYLQKDLNADGYRYRVVNEGVSGNTTKDGVDRLSDVLALKPAVVVLEFGGNDGLRGLDVGSTKANLATMIEALQGSGAKVLLAGITLPPDYGPDYITRFTGNYPSLARQYNVPILPFLLKDVYGVKGMMQADNTHATDQGNEVVARNVLPLAEKLMKR